MEQYEPGRLTATPRRGPRGRRPALTRRSLLRASAGGVLAVGGLGTLTACGIPPAGTTRGVTATTDHSDREKVVDFSNWPEYIDVDASGRRRPTLETFTRRTGIEVAYTEDINDNDEFFGKIKPQLAAGQDTGRDIIVLTDWLAARVIRLGWAQKLDPENLPNAFTHLAAQFRDPEWDPGHAYSYPWQGVSTVIAYNKKALDGVEVTSFSDLLDKPALKGRVGVLSEMRDTVGMTLLDMGKDPAHVTADDYDAAIARLRKAVDKGQIRRFTGNDYTSDLTRGDLAACLAWGGDVVQLQADNPDVGYVIPDAGIVTSTDCLLVPAGARHKTNAERLIDFFYEPVQAAALAAYTNYVSPVDGVKPWLAKIDKSAADNPLIVPDRTTAAKSHAFRSLSEKEAAAYEAKFAKLTGA
ncbi:polyamine ABC transporter substrate-binding protein [Streptomyces thermodiastaticus]|uniref:polyamine ABC transporter substrate-binding protein n=1 Tax=Streptomyces thermodiastaticus TaxID=44061 RepID=UPI001678BF1B|nr:spermidine/putrescine ABC transporter substrate-binding protein [Streptomyces thermodiastaticus]MCE7553126.1 spermidine/putrescine ABC transporter substrate-binding protein [Streptomyces thermodiastaticus]GHF92952.1 ABC transporter substrate-binding protein [Streptomyces thermodiastaticus]